MKILAYTSMKLPIKRSQPNLDFYQSENINQILTFTMIKYKGTRHILYKIPTKAFTRVKNMIQRTNQSFGFYLVKNSK